jgi:GNAT superfamily N-acetyltransferase
MHPVPDIDDLRDVPRFGDVAAERGWREWWQGSAVTLADHRARTAESLGPNAMPLTLIAHRGGAFLGMASLIASDMDARPELTPWIAAVYVEPEARGQGLGTRLVEAATARGFAQGHATLFLCAEPRNGGFYERLGWRRIERDVDGLDIFSLALVSRAAP